VGRCQPFSRHRAAGDAPDEWNLARSYERAAAEWGWDARHIRTRLSGEQLIAYLDAAGERLDAAFQAQVEAVRVGTIVAFDKSSADKWARQTRRKGRGLEGAALEQAIMSLARVHPDIVEVVGR
jgi:hypothetical protein